MASKPIQAAGGIVVREGARPLIAVVQRSKDDAWVLPRGKLKSGESPLTGARREVVEETGHRVRVHEFVGAITYRASGRPKVVQFWRMQAEAEASHELMTDITAVDWLPLKKAVRRLSYPLEKLFLRSVGRQVLRHRAENAEAAGTKSTPASAGKKARRPSGKQAAKKADTRTRPPKPKTKKAKLKKNKASKATPRPHHTSTSPVAPKTRSFTAEQTERAIASIAAIAAKPITAAKRKTILQRMLSRLAG